MFYSETLLSKTGPLARVWLSANLERKLNKSHILQSNIQSSVNAIVDQGQAPMALRLSGQLLLGVVRIYSRKARYLMEDCSEALLKIKMAFRPGNLDLDMSAVNSEIPNPGLNLPDLLAEPQEIPILDESLFAMRPLDDILSGSDNQPLNWESQPFSDAPSVEQGRDAPSTFFHDDEEGLYVDDLDIQIGEDEPTIEMGRDAPPPRSIRDDLIEEDDQLYKDDLDITIGEDNSLQPLETVEQAAADPDEMETDILDFPVTLDDITGMNATPGATRLLRDSQSPLSSARSSVIREMDETMLAEAPIMQQARQPAIKRRRMLQIDTETTLHNSQIRQLQEDRSAILKPISTLPKDPVLLTLMNMQASGAFVSNILGDGRSKGWAPELRGILSIEVIRESSLKRKRDSGVADVDEEEEQAAPQIEIPGEDETVRFDEGLGGHLQEDPASIINLPADEGMPIQFGDERVGRQSSEMEAFSPRPDFNETTMPLVHPEDQGPVSLGTQHAVHILRDHFGTEGESAASQQRTSVMFQDLLPTSLTTKADATKMFFEVLVLATKDAIKVEQPEGELGGPIRIRAKRGLWGAWAEKEAGGEIAEQVEEVSV